MGTSQRSLVPVDDKGTRRLRMLRLTVLALLFLIAARGVAAQVPAIGPGALQAKAPGPACHPAPG